MKIIIIHRNERSLELAKRSAEKQSDTVILISENSMAESMRAAFKEAIQRKWTYLILMGGDQILLPNAIIKLKSRTGEKFFRISGQGYDFLLMQIRYMAPSLYNVSLLPQALEIDFLDEKQPESYVLKQMKSLGYKSIILNDYLAIHDFDQYYKHIYEKGRSEASKFLDYILTNKIIPDLEKSTNLDHRVFLLGITDYLSGILRTPQEVYDLLNLEEK